MNTVSSSYDGPTKVVTIVNIGPQGPQGISGDSLAAEDLNSLKTFTASIQSTVDGLSAETSSYLTELPLNLISGSTQISNLGFISESTDISALNEFTSSAQSQIDNLTAATSSYLTEQIDISGLNTFTGSAQTQIDNLTAATSSYLTEHVNIDPLNTFTGSIQTEVNNLIAATSSYLTEQVDISGLNLFTGSIQTEVDNLTAATSSYLTEQVDISRLNIFTGSIQIEVDNLTDATSSYLTELPQDASFRYLTSNLTHTVGNSDRPLNIAGGDSSSGTYPGFYAPGGGRINVNASLNFPSSAYRLSFDNDFGNTYIAANSDDPEDLEIHADQDILLRADGQVIVDKGLTATSLTGSISASSIEDFDTEVSKSAAAAGFGTGTGTPTDISALNTFTGSIQSEINNLTAATSSYITESTDILPLNTFTGSIQIKVDNLTAATSSYLTEQVDITPLNEFTSSIQTEINNIINETGSYLTITSSQAQFTDNVKIQGILSLGGFNDVSASLAAAVAGGDDLGNHIATKDLNMGAYAITNVGDIDGVDVSTLKSDFDTLEGKTLVSSSSQIASDISGSFISLSESIAISITTNEFNIATLTAATSSYLTESVDISALNAFTGSSQTQINNLTSATSSYALITNISGAFTEPSSSFSTRVTTLETAGYITEATDISALNLFTSSIYEFTSSTQTKISNLTSVTSSYALITNISGAFTEPSGGFSTRITTLETNASSYLTDPITTSSITDFPTEVSRSAAAAGFNGGGGFTPSLSTNIIALNITASGDISASGDITGRTGSFDYTVSNDIIPKIPSSTSNFIGGNKLNLISNNNSVHIRPGDVLKHTFFTSGKVRLNSNSSLETDATLDVNGSIYATFISASGNLIGDNLILTGDITSSGLRIDSSGGAEIILDSLNSNYSSQIKFSSADDTPSWVLGMDSTVPQDFRINRGSALNNANGIFITSSTAYVGLGTTKPYERLTVEGNISASGNFIGTNLILEGGTFTSASLASAIVGADNLGNHTASLDLNLDNFSITNVNSINAISLTGSISASSIEDFDFEVSKSAAASGFGTGGDGSTDISSLNAFTSSIQTEVNTLTAATSSYLTSPITTSSITDFNTEVSRSAAAAGFGTEGGGGFTPSLSTDFIAANITASGTISASGDIIGRTGSFDYIEVDSFVNQGTGVPTISSATNLVLSASNAILIKDLLQLNGTTTGSILSPLNGSIIYDNDQHKFFGYANGSWVAFN